MAAVYDRWERLVRATLRREQLRLCGQRTPSELSLASSNSSFSFSVFSRRLSSPSLLFGKTFEYDEILQATNYFSQSNLIKHGRSGDLFRGVLENGTRVLIKRVDMSSVKKELCFMSELKALGKLSDCGLVPLQGHSLENLHEKCLVYKYMSNRDLSTSFYSKVVPLEYIDISQNWRTRSRIAIGLAEALCYLHHQCVPALVHRDVQASSVLLDDNFEVRLCSLGDVCTQERESNQTTITREGFEQGTSGIFNETCAYDVYCFGKVLLELVTGQLGASADSSIMKRLMDEHHTQQDMNRGEDLLELVTKQGAAADSSIMKYLLDKHHTQLGVYHVEPHVDLTLTLYGDESMQVPAAAMIAKACLNPEPSRRPLMADVLMALKDALKVVIAEDGKFQKPCPASLPGLVDAALPRTIPWRSKLSRLVLGAWLRA